MAGWGEAVSCLKCAIGSFQDAEGAVSCTDCAYGKFSAEAQAFCCNPGEYFDAKEGQGCTGCPKGTRWTSGSCEPCEAGSQQNEIGSLACVSCGAGTYQDLAEQALCNSCGTGTYGDAVGAMTEDVCQACMAGFFCSTPASQTLCSKGSYCPAGSVLPIPLSSGYFAVDSNGLYTETGGIGESICPAGYFCSGGDKVACNTEGDYCSAGVAAPVECKSGHWCPDAAHQNVCETGFSCPAGSVERSPCQDGASCLLPGARELLIFGDTLNEVKESEVVVDAFQYALSLSTQPSSDVVVVVTLNVEATADCVAPSMQAERVRLLTPSVTFTPENWSEPQVVQTESNANVEYQGRVDVQFDHSVQTDDSSWTSALLRSVSLVILDDGKCPSDSAQFDTNGGVRICQCLAGFYVAATDPLYCDSATACVACSKGMVCDTTNLELENVMVEAAHYRLNKQTRNVVRCPDYGDEGCQGSAGMAGRVAGDDLCAPGHTGVMCQLCEDDNATYVKENEKCVLCEGTEERSIIGVCVALGVIFVGMLVYVVREGKKTGETEKRSRDQMKPGEDGDPSSDESMPSVLRGEIFVVLQTRYKIFVRLAQTMSKVLTLYPITFPDVMDSWTYPFAFVDVDVNVLPWDCVLKTNFHTKLIMVTVTPIVFVVGVVATCAFKRFQLHFTAQWHKSEKAQDVLAKSLYIVFLFLFSIFPLVSTVILQTFRYDDRLGDGESYLIADYSIRKSDASHQSMVAYGAVMFCIYCIGIPGVSCMMLYSNRDAIKELQDLELKLVRIKQQKREKEQRANVVWKKRESTLPGQVPGTKRSRMSTVVLERITSFVDDDSDELSKVEEYRMMLKLKQKLLKDPVLRGLSPLYRDYNGSKWWFEILQFVSTLLVASIIPTVLPVDEPSIVYFGFFLCTLVLVVLCQRSPYLHRTDNMLAQLGQIALVMILSVGLLGFADANGDSNAYGYLLIVVTTVSTVAPLLLVAVEFVRLAILAKKAKRDSVKYHRAWKNGQKDIVDREVQAVFSSKGGHGGPKFHSGVSMIEMTSLPTIAGSHQFQNLNPLMSSSDLMVLRTNSNSFDEDHFSDRDSMANSPGGHSSLGNRGVLVSSDSMVSMEDGVSPMDIRLFKQASWSNADLVPVDMDAEDPDAVDL
jgi:hypothetical protein